MGENIDVKALRARLLARAEMAGTAGGGSPRSPLPGFERAGPPVESGANGAVRHKPSPIAPRPFPGLSPTTEPQRFAQPPHGVFPRPPPSHRSGPKEPPRLPPLDTENQGKVKFTGELLQNQMLRHQVAPISKATPPLTATLQSQRSMSEVAPLRTSLPSVGQRPGKPKRPPHVSLEHFQRNTHARPAVRKSNGGSSPSCPGPVCLPGPARPPNKPSSLTQSFSAPNVEEQQFEETYDDIDLPPPPPPPLKYPVSRDSDSFSSQVDEESDQSEIYEPIDNLDDSPKPPSPDKKKLKEMKRQQVHEKKEQERRLKMEIEFKKRFKLAGVVEVLHTAKVREDWQGGKNDLCVRQGESVEIIRVKDNPEGKWLARTLTGTYGYVSNRCVDVDYEEVKRKLRSQVANASLPPPLPAKDNDFYDDIGASDHMNSSLNLEDDVYDDVDHGIPEDLPPPPPEIRSKKLEKDEKEFRKKFKFEGPIKVLCLMMVDPNANIKRGGGKDLTVVCGEILDVIQNTNDKKALCRNEQGKYGYVPRVHLLHAEGDIYDDIDNISDVYDNDAAAPLRS